MKTTQFARFRPSGSIRAGCLVFTICGVLLLSGAQGIYIALNNRQPLQMTCKEYLEKKPAAKWITLTDAHLDLSNAATLNSRLTESVKEVFIPLRAPGDSRKAPIQILLASKEKAMIDRLASLEKKIANFNSNDSAHALEILNDTFPLHPTTGLVRYGIDADSKNHDKLARLDMPLAPDFVIMDEGNAPSLFIGICTLGAGIAISILMFGRSFRSSPAGPPPSLPPPLPPRVS